MTAFRVVSRISCLLSAGVPPPLFMFVNLAPTCPPCSPCSPLSRVSTTVHVRQPCPNLSTLFTLSTLLTLFSSQQGSHLHSSCSSTLPQLVHLVHLVHLVLLSAGIPPLFMLVNLAPPTSPILLLLATSQSHVSESKKNQRNKLWKQTKLE